MAGQTQLQKARNLVDTMFEACSGTFESQSQKWGSYLPKMVEAAVKQGFITTRTFKSNGGKGPVRTKYYLTDAAEADYLKRNNKEDTSYSPADFLAF